jgi:aryl-alcohol dehydrogenase-like predicted oxidoreductase
MIDSRPLGQTGLVVSRLGLGMAALGRPGYINLGHAEDLEHSYDHARMASRAAEVLDAAFADGCRYFDTARSYGRGEEFLAAWLSTRRISPERAVVGSKWGYAYTAAWRVNAERHEIKDHTLPVLKRQFTESHTLLGDHLDLYQIHSATIESGVLGDRNVIDELFRLRDGGLRIGLSLSGPKQADTLRIAMSIQERGRRLFDTVQATWNILETSAGAVLREAHESGMGVIIKESLANGRLTERNDDSSFVETRKCLVELAGHAGVSLDAFALAAALAQPWADVVLSGAATVSQWRSNLTATQVRWDENWSDRLQRIVERPENYWAARARLPWN